MPSQNACSSPIFRQVSRPQYGFWGRFSGNFRQGIDRFKIWSPIADPQQDVGTPPLFSSEQLFLARQPILDDRQQVFAYELREQLRASARYDLATAPEDAAFAIRLVTIDGDEPDQGNYSAVAATITMLPDSKDIYLNTIVQIVGRDRVTNMVRSLLASVDQQVEQIRRELAGPRKGAE